MKKRKLFILIDWWKENIAVERFKYPTTVTKVEKNIEKLMKRVIESDNSDWYVPRIIDIDTKYTVGSLKKEPTVNEYSEFYTFGMSLGVCVLVSPWGYCSLPRNRRFVLKDCSIKEDGWTNLNEYIKYLKDSECNFENAESEHNRHLEDDIKEYSKKGAVWVYDRYRDRANCKFKREELNDPVKFKNLDEIYSTI
tara:strand:+ start:1880 stop:2464 length:585 start_codon:yes stop_codon:yes gene_type:complete